MQVCGKLCNLGGNFKSVYSKTLILFEEDFYPLLILINHVGQVAIKIRFNSSTIACSV